MICEVIMGKQIAKYKEIEHDILTQIQNGKLQTGDQILTENELCSRYQVSRMTARKALDLLSSKGILTRTPGKGTFVNSIQITKTSNETRSYSNDMRSIGKVPGSILVSYQVRRGADVPEAAEALNIAPEELVHCIERIRTADGIKMALSYTYLPCSLFPSFDLRMLEGSLYSYISQQYELDMTGGDKTISALLPTPHQKQMLEIGDEPLLMISHPGYLKDGRRFEYSETYYIGSRFSYRYERPK